MAEHEMSDAEAEMVAAMEAQQAHEDAQEQAGQNAAYTPPEIDPLTQQSVANAAVDQAAQATPVEGNVNLDMILDVPITLSMEVGRSKIPIRNLMQLNPGSVVELDRVAGQPLDVFVNGTLIAHGEVVVVNEKFGVRLIDVVSPAERIRKLQS